MRAAASDRAVEHSATTSDSLEDDPATAFNWQLGLALAGCAFEAYNEIEADDPSLKMTSLGGTEIVFVDKHFLSTKYAGLLEVVVERANGLPAADWWPGAKSDPYVLISVGGSSAATKVVQQNLDPEWGETFRLFVSNASEQRLTVRVLDADVGKSDDLLGTSMRALQDLLDGKEQAIQLPLRGPKDNAGTLSLRARFLPFDGVLASETASSHMGGPVLGSPPRTITSSQWRTLQREVLNAADAMFDPVAYIDNPETDTQAWLFWNPATRSACLAFRGTEQVKWKDILTDLSLVPAPLDPEGVADPVQQTWRRRQDAGSAASPAANLEAAVAKMQDKRLEARASIGQGLRSLIQRQEAQMDQDSEPTTWVHHGFSEAYASVRSEVLRLLEILLAGESEPWTLYITGHSLGGALSTLCAFDCARRSWRGVPRPNLVHYSYGSPRVGNRAFAEQFDQLVPNAWRVVNSNDAVALVPRMLGYCHVGHKAQLGTDGQLDLMRNTSRDVGEGAEMADVALAAAVNLPLLTEQLLAKQEAAGASGDSNASGFDAAVLQQSKPALLSAASAVAAAVSAVTSAAQQSSSPSATGVAAAAATGAAAAAAAMSAAPTAQEVAALLEEEIKAMSALLDGSALNEHLEPLYLENLTAAIAKLRELKRP